MADNELQRIADLTAERDALLTDAAARKHRELAIDVNSAEAVAAQFDEYEAHLALAHARIKRSAVRLRDLLAEAERYERLHIPFPDCTCGPTGPVSAQDINQTLAVLDAPC